MDQTNQNKNNTMWDENTAFDSVLSTFQAYVDAMIPQSPGLAELYGRIQFYGAVDLSTAEFLIMTLDSYPYPLSLPVAKVLNAAARQYLYNQDGEWVEPEYPDGLYFARMSPQERLETMEMLIIPENITYFPVELEITSEDIFPEIPWLNRTTLMGYYSEWSGYGSTKLAPPTERVMEYFPISWKQIGYPGPSLGYRVARSFDYT